MDWELVMIFGFVLTILMIVMPMAYLFQRKANQHEERKLELLARAEEAKAGGGSGSGEYRKLEERVRVLERIATDGNQALAHQIEQLRDLHELDDQLSAREKTS